MATVISLGHRDALGPSEIYVPTLPEDSNLPRSKSERIQILAVRAEQLDTGEENCFDPRHSNGDEFWEQGSRAFCQDIWLEACPWESGPEQDDWLRGWMATELITFGEFLSGYTFLPRGENSRLTI